MTPTHESGGFTYPDVGATRADRFPAGYHHMRRRRPLGHGRELFARAGAVVLGYGMQRGAGIFDTADTATARPGTRMTVRLGVGPLALVAPCRIVYVLDDPDADILGFAYGTLAGHPECGEELFAVEYDPATGTVSGVVAAFSRPGTWYTRLGGPAVRLTQRAIAGRYLAALPRG
jgi:uncharacterized protein (UPF0548 family)